MSKTERIILQYENRSVVLTPPFTRERMQTGIDRLKQDFNLNHPIFEGLAE